jgi:hypothetical protein
MSRKITFRLGASERMGLVGAAKQMQTRTLSSSILISRWKLASRTMESGGRKVFISTPERRRPPRRVDICMHRTSRQLIANFSP